MSKLYIFGIGGTGSRVLRSFTMMMAAGVKIGTDEIIPIIIDPDVANADLTRTVTLMNNYRSVRKHLSFPKENKNTFFRKEISQILPNYTLQINDTDDKTFQNFIELPSMSRANKAMCRMLFSEKNLTSQMDVGFKGNPNIGSVVLNQIVNSDDFMAFANSYEQGDKIFILSSIFGGTGASGFPLLLKTLRTGNNFPNNDIINKSEIGAVTILPYFKLKVNDESEIDSSTFISKTKSALAYYENNISKNGQINALYYLADDITNTYDNHEGGTSQRNDAHLIEFLAASAIVDFSNKEHPVITHKELGLRDISGSVTFNSLHEELSHWLRLPLTQFTLMANCFKNQYDYVTSTRLQANNKSGFVEHGLYNNQFFSYLKKMTENYREWLKEMKDNKRSLDLFNLECGNMSFNVVTDVKPRKVVSMLSNYDLFFGRLNDAIKHCSGDDNNKLLEMYSVATERLSKEKFNF